MVVFADAVNRPLPSNDRSTARVDTGPVDDADTQLLARISHGDERAFAELVARHSPRLHALALRFTGSAADADDVVQDTFWSAWRKASDWQARGVKVSTWLYRIALNRCIDLDRRRKVRRLVGLDDARDPEEPAPGAEQQAVVRSELAAVSDDVRALPARQRAAILLAATGEAGTGEIAARLGISEGAAEQLLVRARRTLRQKKMAREALGPDGGQPR
ncbi:RNA polymerase sigma-70 factor (ECF subfamily) [Amorphus orientalis]|uniref:RNA polymerase sigma-70 factor (ECF subfamily) n=1 Tax=Amorphus orientalis TaxID=649198 RepID=A0AAE3VMG6_9HYPH|nr:RNA polymerase sigma-70 factor (ECF subfamily) [Amorphus orientalis]